MRKFYSLLFLSVLCYVGTHAQTFSLVKDIKAGDLDCTPMGFTDVNGILFFRADDGVHGFELWKSNGTEAGTIMVKDINAGPNESFPLDLINVNGTVYFLANDGVHGEELWKSDGTEAGTVMVKDIFPGSSDGRPANFFKMNTTLFFSASNGTNGNEIWMTNGTEAGTVMVKDINPGSASSFPISFESMGGTLYFSAITAAAGRELWKSNGTSASTLMVKDIIPGPDGSYAAGLGMKQMNGAIYFAAGGAPPTSLWKSDGTAAGTVLVKSGGLPEWMMVSNGALYFSAFGASFGTELWKTDGTPAGTVMVKDINTSGSSYPNRLTDVEGKLFFLANTGTGNRLWISDGTETGTILVKDIEVGANQQNTFTQANGVLYCGADDGIYGNEIWRSDGSDVGTRLVQDIMLGGGSYPWEFAISGSKLYVSVTSFEYGRELWAANIPSSSSLPLTLIDFRGRLAGNNSLLSWKTSYEHNTSHFEIERSINGRDFVKAGVVSAAGSSAIDMQYDHTDKDVTAFNAPVIYYRLKMKDVDNNSTYSKIIAINISNVEPIVMVYPNPMRESTTLMISMTKKDKIACRITDATGRIVDTRTLTVHDGSNTFLLQTDHLATGVYVVSLDGRFISERIKLVKE